MTATETQPEYAAQAGHLQLVSQLVSRDLAHRDRGDTLQVVIGPERALDLSGSYLVFNAVPSDDGNNETVLRFRRPDGATVWLVMRDDLPGRILGMWTPPDEVPENRPDLWYPMPDWSQQEAVEFVRTWLLMGDPDNPLWDECPEAAELRDLVVGKMPLWCYYIRRYDDAPDQVMLFCYENADNHVIAFLFQDGDTPDQPLVMHIRQVRTGPIMHCTSLANAAEHITHTLAVAGDRQEDNNAPVPD